MTELAREIHRPEDPVQTALDADDYRLEDEPLQAMLEDLERFGTADSAALLSADPEMRAPREPLMRVRPVDEVVWSRVLELWPDAFKDFADAVLAAVTLEGRYEAVASFDQRRASRRAARWVRRPSGCLSRASGDTGPL